jgi:hypothetical protein
MPKKGQTNAVYRCPQSAFLALWHEVHTTGGHLDDLVAKVKEHFDEKQRAVNGKMPTFDRAKAKGKCDRIIDRAEKAGKTQPQRLRGHDKIEDDFDNYDW